MSAIVNYGGDKEGHSGGSPCANPMGLRRLLEPYSPSVKRVRLSSSVSPGQKIAGQERKSSIETLPDECLFEIFRRLPGSRARSRSACVSKRWLMLLSSISKAEICSSKSNESAKVDTVPDSSDIEMIVCYEDLEAEGDGYLSRCLDGQKATDIRLAAIAVGTGGHGGLGKLSIRGSHSTRGVTNLGLSAIAHGCPSLRSLSLWDVPLIGDEGLIKIADGCHLLKKLDLSHCPLISDKGLIAIAKNCPNLTDLSIESCPRIGNEGLQAIGMFCPKLQSICIRDCPLVGNSGVSSLFASRSCVLSKVTLQSLNITDCSLSVIGFYGKAVTNLVLIDLRSVSHNGFWTMASAQGLQNLTSLTIISCRGITDSTLQALGKAYTKLRLIFLGRCAALSDHGLMAFTEAAGFIRSLQLEECNRITQAGIIGALANCGTNLKSLTLVKCMGIKDEAYATLLSSACGALQSLIVKNCPGFGRATLALVGKFCHNLRHLELSGLYGITETGLISLFENCGIGLTKVNLRGCLKSTDEVVMALVRLHGGSLKQLCLDGCREITNDSLVAIAGNCPYLNDLDLSHSAITDTGLAILAHSDDCNLRMFSLSGCSKVTNKSLPYLKKLGEGLEGLNLQNCSSISSNAVDMLSACLWKCDILF